MLRIISREGREAIRKSPRRWLNDLCNEFIHLRHALFSLRPVNFLRALVSRNIRRLSLPPSSCVFALLLSTAFNYSSSLPPAPSLPLTSLVFSYSRSPRLSLPTAVSHSDMQIIIRVLALISVAIPRYRCLVRVVVSERFPRPIIVTSIASDTWRYRWRVNVTK